MRRAVADSRSTIFAEDVTGSVDGESPGSITGYLIKNGRADTAVYGE